MKRILIFCYGIACYLYFFITFLYIIGFMNNIVVSKGIDTPYGDGETPMAMAILINVGILAAFAIQHTIMARPAYKEAWKKVLPEPMDRSTYVILSSVILTVLCVQWRPIDGELWNIQNETVQWILIAISLGGFGIVLYATFLIDHFDLFGLRQVFHYLRGTEYTDLTFSQPLLYRLTRHPLMLGFLIAFWSTHHMTYGRLLFCVVTTIYIFMGIFFEETDLKKAFGEEYLSYRKRTSMIIPMPQKAADTDSAGTGTS